MLAEPIAIEATHRLPARTIRIGTARDDGIGATPAEIAAGTDAFAITRGDHDSIVLTGGSERAAMHAAYALLERLGAPYPARSRIDRDRFSRVEPFTVVPAFRRRAIVSDIMTWHYETPERLAAHLESDGPFIEWMGARGLNAFSYIRHAVDSRLKIDELLPLYRSRGIDSEYGGHVLQLLLLRDRFGVNPEYFPADASGARNPRGNLCVSNADALAIVCDGAIRYARENPECALLHVWGADVWQGAWCRCGGCAAMSPQSQYMKVVSAIAEALAGVGASAPPVAYLAYHETIEPDLALRPPPNVSFEWAPRERCYSHAIDDAACAVNPCYWESLKRYIELFDGRGHVFEYYADAILFGAIAAATPATIARDLCAHRSLGLDSVSCLTFGQHSAIAYPVNLEAFARATRSPDFEPGQTIADLAATRHPACAAEMADAYRAIARASALILDGGGDLMRPRKAIRRATRIAALKLAYDDFTRAIEAADHAIGSGDFEPGEGEVWRYSRAITGGIREYLAAGEETKETRVQKRDAAINAIADAIDRFRAASGSINNIWGACDLEWIRGIWLDALRRRFDEAFGEKS
jgi:hypothetical protein